MMMSVRLMSRIANSGVSPSEQRLVDACAPSIEAIRTRKRGCCASPWSQFHSKPAE